MNPVIEPIAKLTAQLSKLPGIGNKSAQRLAYHILDMPQAQAIELAQSILNAHEQVRCCSICGNYTDVEPCAICTDEKRRPDILCVVRDARDVIAMEKTREFTGKYHVLKGIISPMNGIGPDDIRIDELVERIKTEHIAETILATDPDVQGEATAAYIARLIKPMGVKVTRIAHGVPIGANLEFTDTMTLIKALEGRRDM